MWISGIRITNFKCYLGVHELELQPTVYSLVGRYDDDPARSNYSGKTSFCQAIAWCLYGYVPPPAKVADDLVSRGAGDGAEMVVEMEFDDGTFVARTKKVGKSAVLEVRLAGSDVALTSSGAQDWIDENFGNQDAFFIIQYIEQGEAAKVLKSAGTKLSVMLDEWFDFSKITAAREWEKSRVSSAEKELSAIKTKLSVKQIDATDCLSITDGEAGAIERLEKAEADLSTAQEQLAKSKKSAGDLERAHRKHELQTELAALEIPESVPEPELKEAKDRVTSVGAEAIEAKRKFTLLKTISSTGFDGVCPVMDDECPARDEVESRCKANSSARRLAQQAFDQASARRQAAEQTVERLERRGAKRSTVLQRRSAIEAALAELTDVEAAPRSGDRSTDLGKDEVARCKAALQNAQMEVLACKTAKERLATLQRECVQLEEALEAQRLALAVRKAALQILGPEGVEQRLAQSLLEPIVTITNQELDAMSTGLSLEVDWYRQTNEWAGECYACYEPYEPRSRARECPSCGAAREKNRSFFPRIVLNRWSGGAADIAGLVFQLELSRWRRQELGTKLSFVMVDEPLGQLDPVNAAEVGRRLLRSTGESFGFDQAFIIAHTTAMLDAAKGRIIVSSNGESSRIEVVRG